MKQLRGNKSDLIDRLLQHTLPEQPQITINALFPLPGLICASPHPPRLPASQCQAVSPAIVSRWKPSSTGGRGSTAGSTFSPAWQNHRRTGPACPGPRAPASGSQWVQPPCKGPGTRKRQREHKAPHRLWPHAARPDVWHCRQAFLLNTPCLSACWRLGSSFQNHYPLPRTNTLLLMLLSTI